MLFPFRCLKLEKMSKQKNKSDFMAKNRAELQQGGVLVIPSSAAEMVLTLELNLERDKTGDVRQISWYIHNSHFKIHDHTLLIMFQSIFTIKTVWPFVVWYFPFVYYGKQGLDSSDDGYVDGIYLLACVASVWKGRGVLGARETRGGVFPSRPKPLFLSFSNACHAG